VRLCGVRLCRSAAGGDAAPPAGRLVSGGDAYAENERSRSRSNDDGTFEVSDKATGVTYHRVARARGRGRRRRRVQLLAAASDRRITSADARVTRISRLGGGPLRAGCASISSCRCRARPGRPLGARPTVVTARDDRGDAGCGLAARGVRGLVDNRAADHRLRLLFPAGAASSTTARADTAFDVDHAPARIAVPDTIRNESPVSSMPMISMVDAGDAAQAPR
jgi:alpha-mannosidase/mannosylglycerate hydrolase